MGGQAGSSSLIRNYLGFPRGLGGGELAQRAYQQAWLFGAQFRLTHRAVALAPRRQARRPHRRRRRDRGARRRARARRRVPAPRRAGPDRARGRRRLLRRLDVGGQALAGETVYSSAGATRRDRRRCTSRAMPRPDPRPRRRPRGDDVAVPDRHDRQGSEHRGARTEVVAAHGEGASSGWSCDGRKASRACRPAALIVLIGAHPHTEWLPDEIARDEWGYIATGPDVPGWPSSAAAAARDELPGVFAAATSARSVKRSPPRRTRARSPSATCTPTSPWTRPHGPFTADARLLLAAARRPRDPARRAGRGRAVAAPAVPLLARARDRRPERRPRLRDRRRGARRGDRRVHLVSLSFLAASGFLALHALATPGVLLDKPNLGFVIATPVGLVLASVLAALGDRQRADPAEAARAALLVLLASGRRRRSRSSRGRRLGRARAAVLAARRALDRRHRLATFAVVRYLDLYRERRSRLVLGFDAPSSARRRRWSVAVGRNWQRPGGSGTC